MAHAESGERIDHGVGHRRHGADATGLARVSLHVNLMQGIGWLMILLYAWLFHGPWLSLKRSVQAENWAGAGVSLTRIRKIVAVNLTLGLIVVVIGASGRYWG